MVCIFLVGYVILFNFKEILSVVNRIKLSKYRRGKRKRKIFLVSERGFFFYIKFFSFIFFYYE